MEAEQKNPLLIKATVSSLVVAFVVLVLFILPAEYNIDPTGIGGKLGLTVFNAQVAPDKAQQAQKSEQDFVVLTVPAGKGIEYKLSMQQYQKATYEW